MKREYDDAIEEHYRGVAMDCGLSGTSTMADEMTRTIETNAIIQFVETCITQRQSSNSPVTEMTLLDVGCGNGLTLETIQKSFPELNLNGLEKSSELRELALSRFSGNGNVRIIAGDVRDDNFFEHNSVDILICQRVLINLLNIDDQLMALQNITNTLRRSAPHETLGKAVFIEAFQKPMGILNEARDELGLDPIPPANHNLYLPEDFFDGAALERLESEWELPPKNFLSTHYFVTRVLHSFATRDQTFKRNSLFSQFFSGALKPFVGDFSPLRYCTFSRIAND